MTIHKSCHTSTSHGQPKQYLAVELDGRLSDLDTNQNSMSHVTYESAMSHMNESFHTSTSLVTYRWAMSHMNESCHYQRVMSLSASHVLDQRFISHIDESRHTHDVCVTTELAVELDGLLLCLGTNQKSLTLSTSHVTYPRVMSHMCGARRARHEPNPHVTISMSC